MSAYTPYPQQHNKSGWYWLNGHHYDSNLDLWDPGDPDGGAGEHCARISGYTGHWFDGRCDATYRYVCKYGEIH